MAIKPKAKTSSKNDNKKPSPKVSAIEARTMISFRTKQLTKKKAEKVFGDLGISMSSALNMFLAQVVRDKGMPFLPTAQKKEPTGRAKTGSESAGYNPVLDDLWEEI